MGWEGDGGSDGDNGENGEEMGGWIMMGKRWADGLKRVEVHWTGKGKAKGKGKVKIWKCVVVEDVGGGGMGVVSVELEGAGELLAAKQQELEELPTAMGPHPCERGLGSLDIARATGRRSRYGPGMGKL